MNNTFANALFPISGVALSSVSAGIKYADRLDLCVFEICEGAAIAGVFTQNAFCAAPVNISKAHLKSRNPSLKSYFIINSGNANAGTGQQGLVDAEKTCELIAEHLSNTNGALGKVQVFPFSTGVIGEPLPMSKLEHSISKIQAQDLSEQAWPNAAKAIITTDTCTKTFSKEITLSNNDVVRLTGIAKGSGMIKPDMATMLAYVACDAKVEADLLDAMLLEATNQSFNCISVDGDTSTNDAFMLIASGKGAVIIQGSEDQKILQRALNEISIYLAQAIIRDGEGATKFIEVNIEGGNTLEECKAVAYEIAHSPLVKTAFFASDPNWGRILMALGKAPIKNLDIAKVDIALDEQALIHQGEIAASYTEGLGQEVMNQKDISINVNLNRGPASAKVWTCDFSYDYVKINAEYRS